MNKWIDPETGREIELVMGPSVAIRDGREYVNGEEVERGSLKHVFGEKVWEALVTAAPAPKDNGVYVVTSIKDGVVTMERKK